MKLTPKTFLGKLRRKLGFSDAELEKSKDDEIAIYGFTRKRLQELCEENGTTIEQFLANIEESEKRIAAMKPGERPIVEL